MKILNCEMQKVALAALLLGVFSLSPLARAEDAAEDDGLVGAAHDGMSLSDMRNISSGFNVRLVGDTLYMDGSIPKKCAAGATINMSSTPGEAGKPGRHEIKINLAQDCLKLKPAERGAPVKLSSPALFGSSRSLADNSIDGPICLLHSEDGPEKCDAVPKAIFSSEGTITKNAMDVAAKKAKTEQDEQAKKDATDREKKEQAFIARLNILCSQGDFVGFGAEIQAAKAFLGDVTAILSKVDGLKKNFYVTQIKKAKGKDISETIDAVKDAYENYLTAAGANGWDTEEATNDYADRRIELMHSLVASSTASTEVKAKAIRDLASDLREVDLFNEKKGKLGEAYFNLGSSLKESASLADRDKYAQAEKYFVESLQYGDISQKVKVEAEIAKMYHEATEACLAEAKEKGKGFNTCDALAKKEKQFMDETMKVQAKIKGDDSLEALAGMKQEKIARFGMDGYSMSVQGYGSLNRMGGSYDQGKYSAYTQAQQQFVMQYLMKQSMGQYAMQPGATGNGASSYFK